MTEIPAIFCDIDGVVNKKFAIANYDRFGEPNENMIRVLETLGRDFVIVFITGRWAMGQQKVEAHIQNLLPNIKKRVFCKPHDYPGTTAEFKVATIADLESQGYKFYLGLDDHSAVVGLMHNHGMFVAQVISD
ncbi:MAG: hypothetical protein K2L95_04900 [Alphaproteobacteria bacterium]|nr:hypothetical protein [Alphaproteobacteria bacterium]MDE6571521.1 hypothetical protein [Alphaproteobacteria bacterium]